MGGDEETILKHKVKARDKNHLTNKKPILDIMSQYRIHPYTAVTMPNFLQRFNTLEVWFSQEV